MKKILNNALAICLLLCGLSSTQAHTDEQAVEQAVEQESTQKITYLLKAKSDQLSDKKLILWLSGKDLAVQQQGQTSIAQWQNWQSQYPSFSYLYPQVGYRIEFERGEQKGSANLLSQLKNLYQGGQFKAQAEFAQYQLIRQAVEQGAELEAEIKLWEDYKAFDFADIGDNEADPVLGKLIHQGFIVNF